MRKIRAAAFFFTVLFAIGMFAVQSSPGQMGTNPQTTPGQQPQMTPPSQGTPSAQPGQTSQPSQPSSQGQSSSGQSNIDTQVQILTEQLNLTNDQQGKVRSILSDQHEQAMTLVKDATMSREDKLSKLHSLRETTISKVRDVLTNDQKPKFDQMVQQQSDRMHQQQGGASDNSGASGSTPSGSSPSSTTPPSTTPPAGVPPSGNTPGAVKPPR
jgi:hypothetical protein